MINQHERAYRAWQILIEVALKHKMITYGELANKLIMHHRPLRYVLDIIQNYCLDEKLPPLTILVVNQVTGIPGPGFIAWDVDNFDQGLEAVFNYSWLTITNPFSFAQDDDSYDDLISSLINEPEKSQAIYAKVKVRGVAQSIFREALLKVYDYRCAFTGITFIDCLDAAHIIPWSESNSFQRLDVRNGILMSSIHHRLFDKGFITIDEKFKIKYFDPKMNNEIPYTDYEKRLTLDLIGKTIRIPKNTNHYPNLEWIKQKNSLVQWWKI